ncbi:FACT complex subunit spt16 [Cryptotrichosporon argae]
MSDVRLDKAVFARRVSRIFAAWDQPTDETAELGKVDALQVLLGESNDDQPAFSKSVALQTYLLSFEFPSTLVVFRRQGRKVTFVCSATKAKILRQLEGVDGVEIEIFVRAAKDESTANVVPNLIAALGNVKLGVLPKDAATGKLADEWNTAVAQASGIETVDVTASISAVLAEKDGEEIAATLTASRLASTAMTHYFKSKMEALIDRGTAITHEAFAALVEEKTGNEAKDPDQKLWRKDAALGDIDFGLVDWVYTPIIQSGGDYDLKVSAFSNEKNLKPGVILSSLGMRYKSYSASIGRTFLISPHKKQEAAFKALLDIRQTVLRTLKDGVTGKDVYASALAAARDQDASFGDAFVKNIGFATGIEYRDSSFLLGPKNERKLKENMVVVLSLGFQNLPDPKAEGQTYSLLLQDTVKIGQEGGEFLTEGCTKLKDLIMDIEDEESEPEPIPEKKPDAKKKSAVNGKSPAKMRSAAPVGGRRAETRGKGRAEPESTVAQRIKAHQAELHSARQKEGLAKYASGKGTGDDDKSKVVKKHESYRREEQLPSIVQDRRIYVDEQRQTVVLPINGFATPFHISIVKNVTKTEENDYIVLRLNFQSPGQIAGKKEDMPFEDPDANFVRSVTFRSKDHRHMLKVYEGITGLKKAATKREAERKEMADVIEQEKLVEIKGRHPYVLKNVYPRPATEGKKSDGNLEIHQNGIRFRPDGPAAKIDVLFSNIKHLFFQPSEKELIVLIHVHLKAPIVVGKKKTYDVQFFREVSDAGFDETTGKRRKARYGDEDEIEQEQEDRKRRQELDRLFHSFSKRISDAAQSQGFDLEVDIPFREIAFTGVPNRTDVLLQPTTDCLVNLTELPFTVITLNEVEIAHFERVQFGLKAFDVVFVYKNYKKAPTAINNIPVTHLDNVKEWCDSVDIPISEGPVNLSWPQIMKTVNEDPYDFFSSGGWDFLVGGGDSGSESEESEGSVFEDESDAFSGSDDDSDDSAFSDDSGSDSGSEAGFSDESGESWDALERKAAKADDKRKAAGDDLSDDDKKGKKGAKGRR